MHVKTDEIRSVPELVLLHQIQFPGFNNVLWLWLCKILAFEEVG